MNALITALVLFGTFGAVAVVLVLWVRHDLETKYEDWTTLPRGVSVSGHSKVDPKTLRRYRAAVCGVCVCVYAVTAAEGDAGARFFTVWTYFMMLTYFGLSAIASCKYDSASPPPIWLDRGLFLLFEVVFSSSLFLDMVVWTALYGVFHEKGLLRWPSVFEHILNFAMLLGDFALSAHPVRKWHIAPTLLYGGGYLLFAWLYFAYCGFFAYPFLPIHQWVSVIWYSMILVLQASSFGLVYLLHVLKDRLLSGKPIESRLPAVEDLGAALLDEPF